MSDAGKLDLFDFLGNSFKYSDIFFYHFDMFFLTKKSQYLISNFNILAILQGKLLTCQEISIYFFPSK